MVLRYLLILLSAVYSPVCRYYEDLTVPKPTLAEKVAELEQRKPVKEAAKVLDADELLREAEEQAGDDQVGT
jgi:hypothetical protein